MMSLVRIVNDPQDQPQGTPDERPQPAMAVLQVGPDGAVEVSTSGYADTHTGSLANESTVFHACSMAKLVTAVAVLRTVQDGGWALDDDVRDFVPVHVAAEAGRAPTLRELLSHVGGIDDPPGSFQPTVAKAPSSAEVVAGTTTAHQGPIRVTRAPGRSFSYSDAGYCVLERALERVSGLSFAVAVHRLVTQPLGLSSMAMWDGASADAVADRELRPVMERVIAHAASGHDATGQRVAGLRQHYAGLAASSLWTTAGDFGALLFDLTRSLSGGDGELLAGSVSAEMVRDGVEEGVGLGVFVLDARRGVCVMSQGWGVGFQGQARMYPAERGAMAVLTNRDPGVDQSSSEVGKRLRELAGEHGWSHQHPPA